MMNFILSKNDAVIAGGCFLRRISVGFGDDTQSWLPLQIGLRQHSGSSQSTSPSKQNKRHQYHGSIKTIYFKNVVLRYKPLSLSLESSQICSLSVVQSGPSQPSKHLQAHAPSLPTLHWPCPAQARGQPSSVQCRPFQPDTQRQVPFLHWPWSLQRASHSFEVQNSPVQPESQTQDSPTHRP